MRLLRAWWQRLLERPSLVGVEGYADELALVEARIRVLGGFADSALTAAALRLDRRSTDAPGVDETGAAETGVELCALGREAVRRALGRRLHDVQLVGVMELLRGRVVQMGTGEGKTLVAALAAAGCAGQGYPVHLVTVNDYLARRDAEWMAPVHELLGVSVGWVGGESTPEQRRTAYRREVTYGSITEIGFDLLRDRLCTDPADRVQRAFGVAIVDEADAVLVDEARVPLVLAGSTGQVVADDGVVDLVASLRGDQDFESDEQRRNVWLTDRGIEAVESAFDGIDLYSGDHDERLSAVNLALHARVLLDRDVDYLVRGGRVHLISSTRGRLARLQRWPDGLHAAVEAKEGVAATEGGEVLDSITVQGLLGRYSRICGLSGTATAVSEQLREFYGSVVSVVPPNVPSIRVDEPDRVHTTVEAKESAVVACVAELHALDRPVLVGTRDVAESERIAAALTAAGVRNVVLNAANDAQEAAVVAEAGAPGAVTVSTQLAGRGTDIVLGGSDGDDVAHDRVVASGGLHVVATSRYASSRHDEQLRGRSARQRVAEGVDLETHRQTWRYTRLVEQHREVVLARREQVLRTEAAAVSMAELNPRRWFELSGRLDPAALHPAARQIALVHLDQRWTRHLAALDSPLEADRERALGRARVVVGLVRPAGSRRRRGPRDEGPP